MTRTKLELQTAPNSGIGGMPKIIREWECFARIIEELLNPKKEDELILWRLTYNWHQSTVEEMEEREMPTIPLIFGTVSLVKRDNLWTLGHCPYVLEFVFEGGPIAFDLKKQLLPFTDEQLAIDIVRWLNNVHV